LTQSQSSHHWLERERRARRPEGLREDFEWPDERRFCVFSLWFAACGCFQQSFNLQRFPLDLVDLRVDVALERSADFARLATPAETAWSAARVGSTALLRTRGAALLEFELVHRSVVHAHRLRLLRNKRRSLLEVRYRLRRHLFHYAINLVLPNFLVASCSFVASALHPTAMITSRVGLISGLLLTHLAFRSGASAYLPRVSYSTLIDLYLAACLVVIVAALVLVAVVGSPAVAGAAGADATAWSVLAAAWLAVNLLAAVLVARETHAFRRCVARLRAQQPATAAPTQAAQTVEKVSFFPFLNRIVVE
jgi:hypothetical protein